MVVHSSWPCWSQPVCSHSCLPDVRQAPLCAVTTARGTENVIEVGSDGIYLLSLVSVTSLIPMRFIQIVVCICSLFLLIAVFHSIGVTFMCCYSILIDVERYLILILICISLTVMLNIFSCAYLPNYILLWWTVNSSLLPIFLN